MNELDYLLIPHQYMADVRALQWSPACDAITDEQGNTLLLAHSLAQFLEGAGARERLPHFGFVLHFLQRLLDEAPAGYEALRQAWSQASNMRNAGALFNELTHALPRVPGSLDLRRLCAALRQQTNLVGVHWLAKGASAPPLSAASFDAHLLRLLNGMTAEDLRHWLRHGRGPRVDDKAPPLELPAPAPRTLGSMLEDALKRKRMAGVAPFIDQMISALTLPPRRVQHSELPVGGYSSVTNRGHPDQILPGEFAVDELEFLRRYAENELLYWQREEPQSQVREDMIVLCDQGVRTWGDTRLALAAAAIALGRRAERRGTPVRFAATGNDGVPVSEDLPALIEASDLTPNPGLALERVLEEPALEQRDVVLLTHPRSLSEPDVRAAARRAPGNVRLFALAVDETGAAELSELRRGENVSLRRFQLLRQEPRERPPAVEAAPDAPWQGPLEPVPWPFRFGLVGPVQQLAMDADGRYLFTVCNNGLLHAWRLDGEGFELLPRALEDGAPLKNAARMVGVKGGVAILYGLGGKLVLAHYDFVARRVSTRPVELPGGGGEMRLDYLPDFHCVLVRRDIAADRRAVVLDLDAPGDSARAREALARHGAGDEPLPPVLKLISQPTGAMLAGGSSGRPSLDTPRNALLYQARDGRVALLTSQEFWKAWTPKSDGGPLLRNAFVREAVAAGNTLAMRYQKEGHEHVLLLRGPEWAMLGEFNSQIGLNGLAISADGRHVAFKNKPANVVCFAIEAEAEHVQAATQAHTHSSLTVEVGNYWITVYGGKFTHLLRWDRERLEISFLQGENDVDDFIKRKQDAAALNPQRVRLKPGQAGPCRYDHGRFSHYGYSAGGLLLAVDNTGQLAVFGAGDRLLAMIYVYRGTVAAWLPDGTRYGPAGITGGPTSPQALAKIGAALKNGGR
ncbi:MAG: hypothetical protein ICCCNLDF_03261 [Planctomycetes bacterium]|nr:hypothetical protein [Planctomycetota bacterium]